MKKSTISVIISLFILIALPVVSVIYSYKGSLLRKTSLKELEVKSVLPTSLHSKFNTGARYRILLSNYKDTASLKLLLNQFIEEKVEFAFINDTIFQASFQAGQTDQWRKKGMISFITDSDFTIKNNDCVLVNDKYEVLNTYDLSRHPVKTKLVEHLAFLITKK